MERNIQCLTHLVHSHRQEGLLSIQNGGVGSRIWSKTFSQLLLRTQIYLGHRLLLGIFGAGRQAHDHEMASARMIPRLVFDGTGLFLRADSQARKFSSKCRCFESLALWSTSKRRNNAVAGGSHSWSATESCCSMPIKAKDIKEEGLETRSVTGWCAEIACRIMTRPGSLKNYIDIAIFWLSARNGPRAQAHQTEQHLLFESLPRSEEKDWRMRLSCRVQSECRAWMSWLVRCEVTGKWPPRTGQMLQNSSPPPPPLRK